jgi:hypothetical protein
VERLGTSNSNKIVKATQVLPTSSIFSSEFSVFDLNLETFCEGRFKMNFVKSLKVQTVVFCGIMKEDWDYLKNTVFSCFQVMFHMISGEVYEPGLIEFPQKFDGILGELVKLMPCHTYFVSFVRLALEAASALLRCSEIDLNKLDVE